MVVGAVRRSVRVTIAGLLLAVVFPTVAAAATKYLTVSGEVSGAEAQNLAVLLVANDGTSTRVPVNSTGKFTAKIPAAVAGSFVVSGAGKGPTLHLLSSGKYAGPVVLGKKNSTTGYTRMATKNGRVVLARRRAAGRPSAWQAPLPESSPEPGRSADGRGV